MLAALAIRNIVIVDALNVAFSRGLTVLLEERSRRQGDTMTK